MNSLQLRTTENTNETHNSFTTENGFTNWANVKYGERQVQRVTNLTSLNFSTNGIIICSNNMLFRTPTAEEQ